MKSLSVYRGVRQRIDPAPKPNQYKSMTLSAKAELLSVHYCYFVDYMAFKLHKLFLFFFFFLFSFTNLAEPKHLGCKSVSLNIL